MDDLRVIFVLNYKDEMIEKGIIPKDVKWDLLTKKQKKNVKKFIEQKIEEQKRKIKKRMQKKKGKIIC